MTKVFKQPIKVGDVAMFSKPGKRSRVAVILENTEHFSIVFLVKSDKQKKVKHKHLKFPDGYFENRSFHIQDCAKQLT